MQLCVQRAQVFADCTRRRILLLLLEGEATVSAIVVHLGIPQPQVSTHLAYLRKAGLVTEHRVGRQRVYHLDAAHTTAVLEVLRTGTLTTLPRSQQAERQVRHNTTMRQARTCYDHLAGVAGVQLLDVLFQRRWLVPNEPEEHARVLYHLTSQGTQALRERGVDVVRAAQTRRHFAFGCIDWTERRTHLGGALGAAILEAMGTAGIVQRQLQSRGVVCHSPVVDWLDTSSSSHTA